MAAKSKQPQSLDQLDRCNIFLAKQIKYGAQEEFNFRKTCEKLLPLAIYEDTSDSRRSNRQGIRKDVSSSQADQFRALLLSTFLTTLPFSFKTSVRPQLSSVTIMLTAAVKTAAGSIIKSAKPVVSLTTTGKALAPASALAVTGGKVIHIVSHLVTSL